jgi:hypothetical protein
MEYILETVVIVRFYSKLTMFCVKMEPHDTCQICPQLIMEKKKTQTIRFGDLSASPFYQISFV